MSPAAARVAPFAVWIVLMAAQSLLPSASVVGVDPAWGYAVRTLVVAVFVVRMWLEFGELRPGARLGAARLVEATALGVVVFAVWIWLGPLVRIGDAGGQPVARLADGSLDPLWLVFRLAGTALVVPIIEELFWRSFVARRAMAHDFDSVDPRTLSWAAMLASSALFALEHREIAAGFVAGMAYAWAYRRHGDLRVGIIAHGVTNAALGAYVITRGAVEFW